METAFVFILFIIILIILGVGGFFIYDYSKYKKDLDDKLVATEKSIVANQGAITTESKARLSNMKYVVDQINDTNLDIYNTFTSNVEDNKALTNALSDKQTKILAGIDSFLRFSTAPASPNVTAGKLDLLSLPGAPTANIDLIKHVTALNGMTFKELSSANNVKLCGISAEGVAPKCIELPNKDGNTVLTNLVDGRPMLLDADTQFTSNITLANANGASVQSTSLSAPLKISSNKYVHVSNYLTIGDTGAPQNEDSLPTIGVYSMENGKDALKVSTRTKPNAVRVDPEGRLVLGDSAAMETDQAHKFIVNNTNGVKIQSIDSDIEVRGRNIVLDGTVNITGNVLVNGQPIKTA